MSKLHDHKQWWKAPFKYVRDYLAFHKCDLLLTDTHQHRAYFSKTFNLTKDKLHTLHIGTQINNSNPANLIQNSKFKVGFYGRYQPLQGAEQIVKAAKILQNERDIEFNLIGNFLVTPAYPLAKKLGLKNISFEQEKPMKSLFTSIEGFDVCLGVFGNSVKAQSVIPNKVYHYASFGKGIITRDTPGIKEVFQHNQTIYLCDGTPKGIANSILELKNDRKHLGELGRRAKSLMEDEFTPEQVAKRFVNILQSSTS
jgi:glycosyltransferase involved in cell wall biosynthesis